MPAERNDGGQAFPMPLANEYGFEGMSLRDYFAGQALAGLIGGRNWSHITGGDKAVIEHWALSAYGVADAMLAERAKEAPDHAR